MKRAPDIVASIARHVQSDIATFNEADQQSGLAAWLARWWNELPDDMTDDQAREYLGLTREQNYRDCFCKLLEGEKSENQRKTNGSIEGNS